MIKVRRANVVLRIDDDEKRKYLDMGYNVISETGELLEEALPVDIGLLQKCYIENKAKIKSLEEEIVSLKEKLAKAEKVAKTVKKQS